MGWPIGFRDPPSSGLLDLFFRAIGKSLYLGTQFEGKCRYVLRVAKIARMFEETEDASAAINLAKAITDPHLAQAIKEICRLSDVSKRDAVVLLRGKDSRNFIAHEAADVGELFGAREADLEDRIETLRERVDVLLAADNLVSRWVYEIDEKEPAPPIIQAEYPARMRAWIFAGFEDV